MMLIYIYIRSRWDSNPHLFPWQENPLPIKLLDLLGEKGFEPSKQCMYHIYSMALLTNKGTLLYIIKYYIMYLSLKIN